MIKNKKEYNFFVVLFKNKTKKKIINKFITFNKAKEFYNSMLKNQENIIFSKHYDDGVKSEYELSLMSKQDNVDETIYTKDLLGRTIKIEVQDDNFKIKLIILNQMKVLSTNLEINNELLRECNKIKK